MSVYPGFCHIEKLSQTHVWISGAHDLCRALGRVPKSLHFTARLDVWHAGAPQGHVSIDFARLPQSHSERNILWVKPFASDFGKSRASDPPTLWAAPDPSTCQTKCQIDCQNTYQIECQIKCRIECQIDCQIKCQTKCLPEKCRIKCQKKMAYIKCPIQMPYRTNRKMS